MQTGRRRIGAMTSFTIRDEQKAAIEALAREWDVPQSRIVRQLIDLGLPLLTMHPFTTNHATKRESEPVS